MGKCLARFLGKIPHYRITLFTKDDWKAPQKLADQDLIIISVPIAITDKIIHQASRYLSSKTILSDLTSIKQKPMAAMLTYHTGPVVGMHPVFGPDITHAQNHTIAYCHGRDEKSYQWFIDDLGTLKFTLKKMHATSHDQAMDFIQGVEHFSTYCLGLFLSKNTPDINTLYSLASPVYKVKLNMVGRLFSQDPMLFADIIMADAGRTHIIKQYSELCRDEAIQVKQQNKALFIQQFNQVKAWLGDFTKSARKQSDKTLETHQKSTRQKNIINAIAHLR